MLEGGNLGTETYALKLAKVEPLAPVNDLVYEIVSVSQIAKNETQATLSLSIETQRQHDDDEAIALIMILAEID